MNTGRKEAVSAIQEQIRAAGRGTARLWAGFRWLALLFALGFAALAFAAGGILAALAGGIMAAIVFIIGGTLLFVPYLTVRESLQRDRLRRELSTLRREERDEALLPLRSEPAPYTQEIVSLLIDDFGVGRNAEVTPVALEDGRGDEPAPE